MNLLELETAKAKWGMRKRITHLVAWGIVSASVGALTVSCGDDETSEPQAEPELPSAELTVTVEFANDIAQTVTNSLHVWALGIRDDVATPEELSCGALVAGDADPYDVRFRRLLDTVSVEVGSPVTANTQGVGEALVYVEAVTLGGQAEFAGCVSVEIAEPDASATVTLTTKGVYDCGDPATESGAACDDGSFCTVGETCSGSTCGGGAPRDCSALADSCNAASCSETEGCVVNAVPDGTGCDDALLCTNGDSCQAGVCVGAQIDCEAQAAACQIAIGCSESIGECIFDDEVDFTPCDDDLFCTINDECGSGVCDGEARDCALVNPGDDCNLPTCDEDQDLCLTEFASNVMVCDDSSNECTTTSGFCDGAGACVATPINEGQPCNGGLGTCTSGQCI